MTEFFEDLGRDGCLYCGPALPDAFEVTTDSHPNSIEPATEHTFWCPGCGRALFYYATTGTTFRLPHQHILESALDARERPPDGETQPYNRFHIAFNDNEEYILAPKEDENAITGTDKEIQKMLDLADRFVHD